MKSTCSNAARYTCWQESKHTILQFGFDGRWETHTHVKMVVFYYWSVYLKFTTGKSIFGKMESNLMLEAGQYNLKKGREYCGRLGT